MKNNQKSAAQLPYGHSKDVLYQVSLLQGLTNGDYYGSVTIQELKQHGNTGIGTFHRLNGELIMLDGKVYRAAGDGRVEVVSDAETSPFSVVTFLEPDEIKNFSELHDWDALCSELNRIVETRGKNHFYMIRIDGLFREMHVRSVYAQEEPFIRLTEVLKCDQTFFDYKNIEGSLVGLYCPQYMSYLNAAGWHMHFISKDKTKGGHVLAVSIADAVLKLDCINSFALRLPQNKSFDSYDLSVDQSKDIEKIEKNN